MQATVAGAAPRADAPVGAASQVVVALQATTALRVATPDGPAAAACPVAAQAARDDPVAVTSHDDRLDGIVFLAAQLAA